MVLFGIRLSKVNASVDIDGNGDGAESSSFVERVLVECRCLSAASRSGAEMLFRR